VDNSQRHDGNKSRRSIKDVKPDLADLIVAIDKQEGKFDDAIDIADLFINRQTY